VYYVFLEKQTKTIFETNIILEEVVQKELDAAGDKVSSYYHNSKVIIQKAQLEVPGVGSWYPN
jgi:hypothetical protein